MLSFASCAYGFAGPKTGASGASYGFEGKSERLYRLGACEKKVESVMRCVVFFLLLFSGFSARASDREFTHYVLALSWKPVLSGLMRCINIHLTRLLVATNNQDWAVKTHCTV